MLTLIGVLKILLDVATWIILIQFILSLLIAFNVINTYNEFVRGLYVGLNRLTEPLYAPIRRMLPDLGTIDLSPMVVLILIRILDYVLDRIAYVIVAGGPL